MIDQPIQPLDETKRVRARDVTYWAGPWQRLTTIVPKFEVTDFKAQGGDAANPYLKSVVRLPRTLFEQRVPVGVVSNTYSLAQHHAVAEQCFSGMRNAGIDPGNLKCELGLTELGEWMNLRIYFPDSYSFLPKKDDKLGLRLECYNSVDGSSRLVILLGWLRLVCTNGLVIRETKTELSDIHNEHLDIERIPQIVHDACKLVKADKERMESWLKARVEPRHVETWVNKDVTQAWGKKAACRVYHICTSGQDVEIDDPFAAGEATEKPVEFTVTVPGSPAPAENLFDASQALSWVATQRMNAEERLDWQLEIPRLVGRLAQQAGSN